MAFGSQRRQCQDREEASLSTDGSSCEQVEWQSQALPSGPYSKVIVLLQSVSSFLCLGPEISHKKNFSTLMNLILFRKQTNNKQNQKKEPHNKGYLKVHYTAEIKREDGECELERTSCEVEG